MENNLLLLFSLIAIWLLIISIVIAKLFKRYHRLTSGIKKKDLRSLLENANSQLKEQKKETEKIQAFVKKLEKEEKLHIQKVGFIRFNPFTDTGGNQSFCLTLLDSHDSGIMISSLHSREQTRLYAKNIVAGKAEGQELSKDEKLALKRAQDIKN